MALRHQVCTKMPIKDSLSESVGRRFCVHFQPFFVKFTDPPVSVWVFTRFSSFLPQYKSIHVRMTGGCVCHLPRVTVRVAALTVLCNSG